MKYKLNDLASNFSKEQAEIAYQIQAILQKYNIEIKRVSPVSISFIPWPLQNYSFANQYTIGDLSWNPLSKTIVIQYHFTWPFYKYENGYSRVLKWYLSKWNEEKACHDRRFDVRFVYPGNNASEVILYASRRASIDNLGRIIKRILIQTHEIIENEIVIISSIFDGTLSDSLKTELLNEVRIIMKELDSEGVGACRMSR